MLIWPGDKGTLQITKSDSGLHIKTTPDEFGVLVGGTDYYAQECVLSHDEARELQHALIEWLGQ